MVDYSEFIGLYPLQKTLRFELIPQGRTWDNLEECGYLQDDLERAKYYEKLKELMDNCHRDFIQECLLTSSIDWVPLGNAILRVKAENSDAAKTEMKNINKEYRKKIGDLFPGEGVKKMTSASIIKNNVKAAIDLNRDSYEIESFKHFEGFNVYFNGYHENRHNVYDYNVDFTSVAYRIVIDNFPRFLENSEKYQHIKNEIPEIIEELKKNLGLGDVDQYFQISFYNRYITQKGIDAYNHLISGEVGDEEHVQGLNVLLNLYYQKHPETKKIQFMPLYKQILGNKESASQKDRQFTNDVELLGAITELLTSDNIRNAVYSASELFRELNKCNLSKIYVQNNSIPALSQMLLGGWDNLKSLLQNWKALDLGDPFSEKTAKKVTKWLNSDYFDLDTIKKALDVSESWDFDLLSNKVDGIISKIEDNQNELKLLLNLKISEVSDSIRNENIIKLKSLLDPYLDLIHILKIFKSEENLARDDTFYSSLDSSIGSLNEVIRLYNKTRNYCTKKPYTLSKVKLKLGFPTLASGWDQNKEQDNGCVILRKNDQYYLAVMNPKNKTDFEAIESDDGECYEKVLYKYLTDPVKMIPKVFFSAKGIETFKPSPYILDGYNNKKMKGIDFDKKFLRDYLEFLIEGIKRYDKWKKYEFRFKKAEEYETLDQFYDELRAQGYFIEMRRIPISTINALVNEKKLFLFKISSKDFSEKSRGMPNMHTLYWKALFSPENLEKPRIKLNGEAELFFRHNSIKEENRVIHRKGSQLVARTDADGNPIPSAIYYELFKYRTGQIKTLSGAAKEYLPKLKEREAQYDIVKDRRFTVDKMFFHVAISFNYNVENREKQLNQMVLDRLIEDKDFKIIGIDRGERNLVYYCMINRKGKILEQGSFNIINGTDYHKLLDQRERDNKEARMNWTNVEGIKEMKSGYISHIVSKLSRMIVENNAVLVMENLNYGFKRGRFKIEKQIYQKFESALIDKLNYLVFKDKEDYVSDGRALRGYQLTRPITDVKQIGSQTGVLFYVPAAYTSKIDPTTGYANLIEFGAIRTIEQKRIFIENLDFIEYSPSRDMFAFGIDYRKCLPASKDKQNRWKIYTVGERSVYSKKDHRYNMINLTQRMKAVLDRAGIKYNSNLKGTILAADNQTISDILYVFELCTRMRVQTENEDYIISPVLNTKNEFFYTNNRGRNYPQDADANGAYNIALKGELLFRLCENNDKPGKALPKYDHARWLQFLEEDLEEWKS